MSSDNIYTYAITSDGRKLQFKGGPVDQATAEETCTPLDLTLNYLRDFIVSGELSIVPRDDMTYRLNLERTLGRLLNGYADRELDLRRLRAMVLEKDAQIRLDFFYAKPQLPPRSTKLVGIKFYRDGYLHFIPLHANGCLNLLRSAVRLPQPR